MRGNRSPPAKHTYWKPYPLPKQLDWDGVFFFFTHMGHDDHESHERVNRFITTSFHNRQKSSSSFLNKNTFCFLPSSVTVNWMFLRLWTKQNLSWPYLGLNIFRHRPNSQSIDRENNQQIHRECKLVAALPLLSCSFSWCENSRFHLLKDLVLVWAATNNF